MSKKLTTEQFVEKAKAVHGDRYDYGGTSYANAKEKVKIICLKHGEFTQTPTNHLSGKGCPQCGNLSVAKSLALDQDRFIEKALSIHGYTYDYSKCVYTRSNSYVTIICKEHGEFSQTANGHLNGHGCPECGRLKCAEAKVSNLNEFIKKAITVHGDKYDYSKSIYISATWKIEITCRDHGVFKQTPASHLSGNGCPQCGNLRHANAKSLSLDEFIKKSKDVHKGKYNYSEAVYVRSVKKIKIICPDHGEFHQTPNTHLNGGGCPKCGYEKAKNASVLNTPGWGINSWIERAKKSKNFDGFKIYLVLCGDEKKGEYFLKVGRTFSQVPNRFKTIPYKWKEVYVFQSDAKTIYDIETKLKKKYRELKVIPSVRFAGRHECFSITALDSLMTEFEKLNGHV